MKQDALSLRDSAKHQLEQIKDIETGVNYLSKVKAIEVWAKAEKKDAELQNMIAEQKVRTQRILGSLIRDGQEKGEIAKQGKYDLTDLEVSKLSDFGITHNESSTFQKIASLPVEVFEGEIRRAKEESIDRIELTTSRLIRAAQRIEQIEQAFREEWKTRVQGTMLKLGRYHLQTQGLEKAEYLRSLLRKDLTALYQINNTGGVVKIKR